MYDIGEFQRTLDSFIDILDSFGIRFHLTGGVTSAAYGEPRMTQDVDLVIDPDAASRHIEGLMQALRASRFLFDEQTFCNAVNTGGMFQLLDEEVLLKLDVYVREMIPGELDRSVVKEVFPGRSMPIVSLVDAVISKLVWVRKGSHKSRRDLRILFKTCSRSQQEEVENHACKLNLHELLAEVLGEPDEWE